MTEKLLTLDETAKILRVSKETLRRWDRKGNFKALIINKRGDRRFRLSDVENLINEGQK